MRTSKGMILGLVFMMAFAGFIPGLMPSASAKVTGDNCIETDYGIWCSETVLSDVQKFDGTGIGDADNDGQDDIIGVGLSGKVWMASKKNREWIGRTIWESAGEMLIAAIGDADNDGKNEVVVVGMVAGPEADTGAGQVTIIEGSGNYWTATRIFTDTHMVHGAAIGDFDPAHDGNEIVVGSFSYNMFMIAKYGSEWRSALMFTAQHKIRTVVVGDVDDDGANEVTAAAKDNNIYIVEKSGNGWANKTVYTDGDGESRCGIGDYTGDGKTDIVAGGDGSRLALITRSGDQWSGNTIFTDSDKLRGSWIGDVYDGHAGNEILAAGYSGNVTMHFQVSQEWKHIILFHDTGRLHHVLIGEVDPDHDGLEIVTAGYSNHVTVIGQYHPDFTVDMTPKTVDIVDQTSVNFKVTLESEDFYSDDISFVVEGLPTGATHSFSTATVSLSNKASTTLTISVPVTVANGDHQFTVKATGVAGTKTVTGTLKVDRKVAPSVTGPSAGVEVEKGQKVMYTFKVSNDGNLPDSYNIEAASSNGYEVTRSMDKTATLQPGESANVAVTVTVPKDAKVKSDVLEVKAKSNHDGTTVDSASVTSTIVKPPSEDGNGACGSIIIFCVFLSVGMVGLVWRKRSG